MSPSRISVGLFIFAQGMLLLILQRQVTRARDATERANNTAESALDTARRWETTSGKFEEIAQKCVALGIVKR